MSDELFRVYFDPAEIGFDGYPYVWHGREPAGPNRIGPDGSAWVGAPAIKDIVREQAGHRCVRCGHPYQKGMGEWSPCDESCSHRGPLRRVLNAGKDLEALIEWPDQLSMPAELRGTDEVRVEAQWRILTVHHLNGIKHDCRWWNLASLCQRCHLTIQSKVFMDRPYDRPHSEWFKPYAAGFYAWKYLGLELSRDETLARLDELLDLELRQEALW